MLGINTQCLNTRQRGQTDEPTVIRDCPVAKQPRQQGQRMIGQRWIDERFLPVEGFRRAATGKAVFIKFALDDFRKEF